jgi:hypothetical protein
MSSDDLKPLPPELEALLEAERGAPGASVESRERVRARLAVSVGAAALGAAGAAHGTPALGTSAGKTVVSKLLLAKLGLAVVAVVGVGVGVGVGVRRMAHPRPSVTLPASSPVAAPRPEPESATASPAPAAEPAPVPTPAAPAPTRHTRPTSTRPDLAAERALVDEASRSLAGGDAPGALAALGRHASRYPGGQLAEERDALRIRALAAAGRAAEARARAAHFARVHPRSIFQPAVDATLRSLP